MGGNFQISMPVDRFEERNMLRGCTTCKLLFFYIDLAGIYGWAEIN